MSGRTDSLFNENSAQRVPKYTPLPACWVDTQEFRSGDSTERWLCHFDTSQNAQPVAKIWQSHIPFTGTLQCVVHCLLGFSMSIRLCVASPPNHSLHRQRSRVLTGTNILQTLRTGFSYKICITTIIAANVTEVPRAACTTSGGGIGTRID